MTRRAVVLAGGRGSRLAPYTTILLPVGERPILEILPRQLGTAGLDDVTLAVGHPSHLVRAVVGDGSGLGVSVRYHDEDGAVGSYAYDGYWLDIGREDDFRRAQADAASVIPAEPAP